MITKKDVTFILKVGDVSYTNDGVIKSVDFVYRGDYAEYNWGFKRQHTFAGDSSASGFTQLDDVTQEQVSSWITTDLEHIPDVDIEMFRGNPDQDLSNIRLPSPIESFQIMITNEINGFINNIEVELQVKQLKA
jgi:hypothetical protein